MFSIWRTPLALTSFRIRARRRRRQDSLVRFWDARHPIPAFVKWLTGTHYIHRQKHLHIFSCFVHKIESTEQRKKKRRRIRKKLIRKMRKYPDKMLTGACQLEGHLMTEELDILFEKIKQLLDHLFPISKTSKSTSFWLLF